MPQRRTQRRSTSPARGTSRTGSGRTYEQLYEEAKKRGIKGRSKMNKAQLEKELGHSR